MPVSGNKESGVIARQPSTCSAGIPIKKRRFPLVSPPSPTPQERSSLHAENDLPQKEHSNASQESSLSTASFATNSPGTSDVNKNSFPEGKEEGPADANLKTVQKDFILSRVKVEEPSLSICSSPMNNNMYNKENFLFSEKAASQKISDITKLHLSPNEALELQRGKGLLDNSRIERECKLELSTVPRNAELSLGRKEPIVTSLVGQNSESGRISERADPSSFCLSLVEEKPSGRISERADPSSFCLSLSEEKPLAKCKSDDLNLNNERVYLHANRSNWDLNTTMDAWEGSVGDAVASHGGVGFDGSNGIGVTHDAKPALSSLGTFGVNFHTCKQILGRSDQRSNFPTLPSCSSQLHKCEDSLHLSLGTSLHPSNLGREHSGPSPSIVSSRIPNSNLLQMSVSTGNTDSAGGRTIKSEPYDENAKCNYTEAGRNPSTLMDIRAVKHEAVERHNTEALKLSNNSSQKLVEHIPIKSEPVQHSQEIQKATEETSHQLDGKDQQCENSSSSLTVMPLNNHKPCPPGLPTCSTELSMSGDMSNQPGYSDYGKESKLGNVAPHERPDNVDKVASHTGVTSVHNQNKGSNVSEGRIETSGAEDLTVDDPKARGLKLMNELPPDSRANGEGLVSDEEKLNISTDMLEDDSYGSDYDSDGNHAVVNRGDVEGRQVREDDEYEDGEVREPLLDSANERPLVEKKEVENVDFGDCDIKNVDSVSCGDGISTESKVSETSRAPEDCVDTSNDHIKECLFSEKADQGVGNDGSCQESLTVEVAGAGSDEKRPVEDSRRNLLDQSGSEDIPLGHERELSSAGATDGSQGMVTTVGQAAAAAGITEGGTDLVDKADSTVLKTDPSLNVIDAAKDGNAGGNRSRIITLPRATNMSPCKTSSVSGRLLSSPGGRERYIDFEGECEGDKLYPRGNRDDDTYNNGPRKFYRERIQDRSLRNPRFNFGRGRGRFSSRLDARRGDWDSDRDFAPEFCNGPPDYRFSRHKRSAAAADPELDCNDYIVAPDITGTGRGGRKPLNDELPSFRHPSSRRRSPRGRNGPATRGIQMLHRMPRNISPDRCIGEDGSDMVGLRRGEKFMRGLPDDILDPVFTHSQPPFDGVDRNFASVQRRGLPRIRSKSPIRPRTRSPCPWSSPRRRSPNGFNGLPELTHRRSPGIYRMDRMRSPDRPCFPEEMMARRHGSPPYISSRPPNDLRVMESGREHGHLRSVMPNRRSPSDRILARGTRRFDILDPQERTDTDEFFGGPMHSARFHELGSDGNGDERRKGGERRGPVRPFRPHYSSGANGENFRFHVEDGPRPFRFCPDSESEFLERNNLRDRDFDGRIKNRSVNASRRTRNIEELEGNYRHGGQVWHDDGFDDVSRMKRRRF